MRRGARSWPLSQHWWGGSELSHSKPVAWGRFWAADRCLVPPCHRGPRNAIVMRSQINRSNHREETMKRSLLAATAIAGVLTASHWAWAQQATIQQADTVKWGPGSPAVQAGSQQAIIVGDP